MNHVQGECSYRRAERTSEEEEIQCRSSACCHLSPAEEEEIQRRSSACAQVTPAEEEEEEEIQRRSSACSDYLTQRRRRFNVGRVLALKIPPYQALGAIEPQLHQLHNLALHTGAYTRSR